jgi:HK97 family phage major capsid protein
MNDVLVEKALDKLQAEVGDKIVELDAKVRDLAQKSQPGWGPGDGGTGGSRKSVGRLAVESQQVKDLLVGNSRQAVVTMDGTSFFAKSTIVQDPGSPRTPGDTFALPNRLAGIVPGAMRNLTIRDLLPTETATSNQVGATREESFTNRAAGQVAEGEAKPESDLDFDLVQLPVQTIAHFVRASKQVLSDSAALERYLNMRMAYFVRLKEEQQLLLGTGTGGELTGMMHAGNSTAFVPESGDTEADSIRRAIEAVQVAEYSPQAVILNPSDWSRIEREKTTAGVYVLGDGSARALVSEGMPRSLWGVPVVLSNSMPAGQFLTGDFQAACVLWDREQVSVTIGFVNDQFTRNLVTILAEERVALAIHVPGALVSGDLTL